MRKILKVKHRGTEKMVGKLFERDGQHYFLHEEKAPTQQHYTTNAPGGIDVDVIWQLGEWSPVTGRCLVIHQNNRRTLALHYDRFPVLEKPRNWDGRLRYFVDVGFWAEVSWVDPGPWIPESESFLIERPPEKAKWKPIETPKPEDPSPQLGLF